MQDHFLDVIPLAAEDYERFGARTKVVFNRMSSAEGPLGRDQCTFHGPAQMPHRRELRAQCKILGVIAIMADNDAARLGIESDRENQTRHPPKPSHAHVSLPLFGIELVPDTTLD